VKGGRSFARASRNLGENQREAMSGSHQLGGARQKKENKETAKKKRITSRVNRLVEHKPRITNLGRKDKRGGGRKIKINERERTQNRSLKKELFTGKTVTPSPERGTREGPNGGKE